LLRDIAVTEAQARIIHTFTQSKKQITIVNQHEVTLARMSSRALLSLGLREQGINFGTLEGLSTTEALGMK
jgi:uncharacterized protein YjiS (DUF1127 family)